MDLPSELAEIERRNLLEVEHLNQRGGRMLSIVDLLEAGTLSAEMAALAWCLISKGASFLTGAVPGGAGKTALMGALLSFLPPGEPIITVSGRRALEAAMSGRLKPPATLLAHEIGAGHWFGYLWGRDAVRFFGLHRRGLRRVCCLHADTPEEAQAMLCGLGINAEEFGQMNLQLFMRAESATRGTVRRVDAVHCCLDRRLHRLYGWDRAQDRFDLALDRSALCSLIGVQVGVSPDQVAERWSAYQQCLAGLQRQEARTLVAVRRSVLGAYAAR